MSDFAPDINHILNATAKAFNDWQKATQGIMTTTPEDLTSTDPDNLFNQSRPYYFFKKTAILLCGEKTDVPYEDVLAAFKIDDAEYERTKDSFKAWESMNNKQAMQIMTRIARTADLPALTFKARSIPETDIPTENDTAKKAYQHVWERQPVVMLAPTLNQPFSTAAEMPDAVEEAPPRDKDEHQRLQFTHIKQAAISAFEHILRQKITVEMLDSKDRTTNITYCRQFGMYVAHTCMPSISSSLPSIGRNFGGRDHTTALHALKKITRMIITEERDALAIARHVAKTLDLSEDQRYALMSGTKIAAKRWVEIPEEINPRSVPQSPVGP